MNQTESKCPDREVLQQFLLGQLSIDEIENCQQHLSECKPCVETVADLKINDTFTGIAEDALIQQNALPVFDDQHLIEDVIRKASDWQRGSQELETLSKDSSVSMDRAAEVQRLLREPIDEGDLGAIDHYRILKLIGTGSTGIVYLAVDTKLDRQAVLKVLRPSLGQSARTRFIAEAKATAAIHHPNVVMIYEVGNDGPLSYIAMQWIPGRTLEQKLADEESMSVESTRELVQEIAGGLQAAHQHGLIHRDIKPANVWIPDGDDEAKILDFGLVRVNDEDPQLTCTGMIAGTPCFMSPEQSRGDKLDARSDLFSLGCLMYQCLTGQLPFRSDNALATLRSIQMDQPTPPQELDPTIDNETSDLVMCLLEKLPARRPANAASLIRALQTDSRQWEFEIAKREEITKPKLHTSVTWWKPLAAFLCVAALAACGFAFGEQIVRVAMNEGEIIIDTKVDDVKIEIVNNGELVKVIDLATEQTIEIKAGEYEIRPVGDQNSISIDKNVLTLSRGETEVVRVTRVNNEPDLQLPLNSLVQVFKLSNSNAKQVNEMLKPLIGDENSPMATKLEVDERNNQLIVAGEAQKIELIADLIEQLDQAKTSGPMPSELRSVDSMIFRLKHSRTQEVNARLQALLDTDDANVKFNWSLGANNTLMVSGDLESLERVRSLVEEMDRGARLIASNRASRKYKKLDTFSDSSKPYRLDSGDVLGIFIDGVLGAMHKDPPIHQPEPGSGLPPSIGFPIVVEHDGTISLPFVPPIAVRGKTVSEVRRAINKAYKKEPILSDLADKAVAPEVLQELRELDSAESIESMVSAGAANLPLLTDQARILVSLIRRRAKSEEPNSQFASEVKTEPDPEFTAPRETARNLPKLGNTLGGLLQTKEVRKYINQIGEVSESIAALERKLLRDASMKNQRQLIETYNRQLDLLDKLLSEAKLEWMEKSSYQSMYRDTANKLNQLKFGLDQQQPEPIEQSKVEFEIQKKKFEIGEIDQIQLREAEKKFQKSIIELSMTGQDKIDAATRLIDIAEAELEKVNSLVDRDESKRQALYEERKFAIDRQTFWERRSDRKLTQPIYNGSTYLDWLKIAKTERDLNKLNPAIKGIANLAGKYEQREMLEAVMQVIRRGVGIASDDQMEELASTFSKLIQSLDFRTKYDLLIRELQQDQERGKMVLLGRARPFLKSFVFRLSSYDLETAKPVCEKLLLELENFAVTEQRNKISFEFLRGALGIHWAELGLVNNSIAQKLVSAEIESQQKAHPESIKYQGLSVLLPLLPEAKINREVHASLEAVLARWSSGESSQNSSKARSEISELMKLVYLMQEDKRPKRLIIDLAKVLVQLRAETSMKELLQSIGLSSEEFYEKHYAHAGRGDAARRD